MTAMRICRGMLESTAWRGLDHPAEAGSAVDLVRVGGALNGPPSSVHQTVVVGVRADPEPVDATIHAQAQGSMMQADSRTSKLSAADRLELE
jgi:hypothetical protein